MSRARRGRNIVVPKAPGEFRFWYPKRTKKVRRAAGFVGALGALVSVVVNNQPSSSPRSSSSSSSHKVREEDEERGVGRI